MSSSINLRYFIIAFFSDGRRPCLLWVIGLLLVTTSESFALGRLSFGRLPSRPKLLLCLLRDSSTDFSYLMLPSRLLAALGMTTYFLKLFRLDVRMSSLSHGPRVMSPSKFDFNTFLFIYNYINIMSAKRSLYLITGNVLTLKDIRRKNLKNSCRFSERTSKLTTKMWIVRDY